MEMAMYFVWTTDVHVLFSWIRVQSTWAFGLLFCTVLFLAVFRQYLVQCQLTLAGSRSSEETLLYTAHTLIGYLLMLVCMSFNAGLFLAIIAGLGLGYHYFNPVLSRNVRGLASRDMKKYTGPDACH